MAHAEPSAGAGTATAAEPPKTPEISAAGVPQGFLSPMQAKLQQYSAEVRFRASVSPPCVSLPHTPCSLLPQELREFAALIEYKDLRNSAVSGVYVLPDLRDRLLWHGVVCLSAGLYAGGAFRFQARLSPDQPCEGAYPTIAFCSPVLHPLVDAVTGQLDLHTRFPTWTEESRTADAVNYVKEALMLPLEQLARLKPTNQHAHDLLRSNPGAFREQAAACAASSRAPVSEGDLDALGVQGGADGDEPGAGEQSRGKGLLSWARRFAGGSKGGGDTPQGGDGGEERVLDASQHYLGPAPITPASEDLRQWLVAEKRSGKEVLARLLRGTRGGGPMSPAPPRT